LTVQDQALLDDDCVGVAIVSDGQIERCNHRLELLLGCGAGGLIGQRSLLLQALPVTGVIEHARSVVSESTIVRDDGMVLRMRFTTRLLQEPGPRRMILVVEDLSESPAADGSAAGRWRRVPGERLRAPLKLVTTPGAAVAPMRASRNLRFEDRLRDAVARRAFKVFYQPIVDTRTCAPCSMEALLRWPSDDGEWIPPSTFVPVAEANGLIVPLGQWMIEEVCRQLVAWRAQGLAVLPIAINLSPRQLRDPSIVDKAFEILRRTGVEPNLIEFEITETCLMQDIERTIPILNRLASAGIRLAIDDFGTGYSSLAYLRSLPINKVKIDQSFVRGMRYDSADAVIVAAVAELARNLCLNTVAEGVETDDQLQLIRALGCDFCQGYFLHKPAPPLEWDGLLQRRLASTDAMPTEWSVAPENSSDAALPGSASAINGDRA
jgi:EAL domain-containing protein (putative c-di-GMP-specific phosphodiesterase class I)